MTKISRNVFTTLFSIFIAYLIYKYTAAKIIIAFIFIFFFKASIDMKEGFFTNIFSGFVGITAIIIMLGNFLALFVLHPIKSTKFLIELIAYIIWKAFYTIFIVLYYLFFSYPKLITLPSIVIYLIITHISGLKVIPIIIISVLGLIFFSVLTVKPNYESRIYLTIFKMNKIKFRLWNVIKRSWYIINGISFTDRSFIDPETCYRAKYEKLKGNQTKTANYSIDIYKPELNILQLDHYPSADELNQQYKILAKKLHPDNGGDAITFIEMNKAYKQIKKDLERRSQ